MADKIKDAKIGDNLPKAEDINKYVDELVDIERAMDTIREDNMRRVKDELAPHKEDAKELKKVAKSKLGCSVSVLNQMVKEKRAVEKALAGRNNLDDDDHDTFQAFLDQLGVLKDTPLGVAAIESKAAA